MHVMDQETCDELGVAVAVAESFSVNTDALSVRLACHTLHLKCMFTQGPMS